MMEALDEIDGFLLEPLDNSQAHKAFLKRIASEFPDDVLVLNQMKGTGRKVAFQWIKVNLTAAGVRALMEAVDHFQELLAFYTIRHQTIATLPDKVKYLLSIRDSVSEAELLTKIREAIEDGKEE